METTTTHRNQMNNKVDHDAIKDALKHYIDGARAGKSNLMQPAFHANASLVGYVREDLLVVPVQVLFNWIDENGPAPDFEPSIVSIEVLETIAVVRMEVKNWSGKNISSGAHMSDLFNLVKTHEGWKVSQKLFHSYSW